MADTGTRMIFCVWIYTWGVWLCTCPFFSCVVEFLRQCSRNKTGVSCAGNFETRGDYAGITSYFYTVETSWWFGTSYAQCSPKIDFVNFQKVSSNTLPAGVPSFANLSGLNRSLRVLYALYQCNIFSWDCERRQPIYITYIYFGNEFTGNHCNKTFPLVFRQAAIAETWQHIFLLGRPCANIRYDVAYTDI